MVIVISNVFFLIDIYYYYVKNKIDGDVDMFYYLKIIYLR